ncbi:hypothetical protein CL622_03830, partial [archaeon]|nr:hypothetical protein [archaeon]
MKRIYSNISPITKAYTNLNHIFYLKAQNPQKLYLCVWDSFVLENAMFISDSKKTKEQRLRSNVEMLEKLMESLQMDYKIIYLSDAWSRLFSNQELSNMFHKILASLTLDQVKKGFAINYIPFGDIELSRINYIIADYMIATYLPDLFPELSNGQPTHYVTSQRFRVFKSQLDHYLTSEISRYNPPKCVYVSNVPVIMHPEKKIIPSSEMSTESIKKILKAYYVEIPKQKEFYDTISVLSTVLQSLSWKGKEISQEKANTLLSQMEHKDVIEFFGENFYRYFTEVNKTVSNITIKKKKKNIFITTYKEFDMHLKPLNRIKFEILKFCNGNN